jgi:ABC-2 type transport system ATP-binding protein
MNEMMIETHGLRKTFVSKSKGKKIAVEAVKGIDLSVRKGEIFGFLGPNGAGKSTSQKMLSTLLPPTSGEGMINGHDLVRSQQKIRMCLGYVSQAGGTDQQSTGQENLMLQARLYGLSPDTAKKRMEEYIERFQLGSFSGRLTSSYSGGQRRRLDLALGMIHQPLLLLLDEPTAGLDPQSRAFLWEEIRRLKNEGVTVFLSTHYMDEADKLCDTVAIIDHGVIVAEGTPDELKAEIGADIITMGFGSPETAQKAAALLRDDAQVKKIQVSDETAVLHTANMEQALPLLMRELSAAGLEAKNIALSKPSLDDVFLKHTGRSMREDEKE